MSGMNHLYKNVKGQKKEDYFDDYLMVMDRMDWSQYDHTTWPCADMSFPDIDENELSDVWPYKPDLSEPHWINLNGLRSGIKRYGYLHKFKLPESVENMKFEEAKTLLNGIAALKESDPTNFNSEITKYNFTEEKHFLWAVEVYKSSEAEAYGEAEAALKKTNEALDAKMNEAVDAAKAGGQLNPIKGIDMDTWAAANAKLANGMGLEEVLSIIGTEKPIWDEVSAEWNARMSQDTTHAIMKVYGDAFVNSDIGKFASSSATTPSAPSNDNDSAEKVKQDFELYIKIMCHQNAGASQGKDAQSILQEYGLTATDWSNIGTHWSGQMATDLRLATSMGELMTKYSTEFAAGNVSDEISF